MNPTLIGKLSIEEMNGLIKSEPKRERHYLDSDFLKNVFIGSVFRYDGTADRFAVLSTKIFPGWGICEVIPYSK